MLMNTDLKKPESTYVVEDPLAYDHSDDPVVVTTRRAISRVAFVAAEAASRFEREGISVDAMAWMMAPRELFNGAAGLDACLDRTGFTRAVLLHGLSLGMDASPRAIDDLADDDDYPSDDDDFMIDDIPGDRLVQLPRRYAQVAEAVPDRVDLYSAIIDFQRGGIIRQGFHASTAASMDEFRERLATIFGAEVMGAAACRRGVNPAIPLVGHLVAPDLIAALFAARAQSRPRPIAVTAERFVDLES